ncbi:MAG: hypothetical protein DI565_04370 [Ancylobacter novellus]|uniref:DUF6980 domain-containing protein n=1 Tax=Ancylobacter novellus TaxID=921 RepID=A0A2W5KLY6_ANCNO|nr:MAG: hypothetical protein DI565_04370 [Ancylobacter novellus]
MRNGRMTKYCCQMMKSNVESRCEQHPNRYHCPDCLIDYWPSSRRFGIMIHDYGAPPEETSRGSMIVINYCPWCGTKLPPKTSRKSQISS